MRLGFLLLVPVAGCTLSPRSLVEVFPPGFTAAPWLLQKEVWAGSFAEAAPALGDDAACWSERSPGQVWLAVYCHEDMPDRCLKVRCLALPSREAARAAFDALRPAEAVLPGGTDWRTLLAPEAERPEVLERV